MQSAKAGITSVVNVMLPSQRIKQQRPNERMFSTSDATDKPMEEIKSIIEKAEKVVEIEETLVGNGIANALKVFRERGMLGAGNAITKGRTLD